MATFTTISKNRLSWPAPPVNPLVSNNYFLEIGNDFRLLIGSAHRLIIQPGNTETTWTLINKSQYV